MFADNNSIQGKNERQIIKSLSSKIFILSIKLPMLALGIIWVFLHFVNARKRKKIETLSEVLFQL
jgi:hypothetical protein